MANPIPCGVCKQVDECDLLVTDRTPDFQILGAPTIGMCVQCFILRGMALDNVLQAAYAELEASGGEPGVLAAVEADEGEVVAADPLPPAPKSKAARPKAETAGTDESQTSSADVDA
jgi:hypothetical protein